MEYLEEHNELRRNNINETPNQQIIKSNKIELTPNANRKNSDFIINEMKTELSSVMNKHNRGVLIIGICGGQSSGKSMISAYLKKHLTNSYIISEKDFFIGNKERRKSITDDKLKFIDLHNDDDGYSNLRKQRLVETNSIKCFDLDSMYNAIKNIKEGKVTKIQSWDKEKYLMVESNTIIDPQVTKILILEGQYLFNNEEIRNLLDYRIFVETDDDIRLARMVLKENEYIQDKAPALKTFFTIYEQIIKPCYQKFIESSKKYAHLILPNFSFNASLEIVETSVLDFMVLNLQIINK